MEEILNDAGLSEVEDINLSVLVGMGENSRRETQNELTRALIEFTRSFKRFTKQYMKTVDTAKVFLYNVRILYYMFKTLVGQCRIYSHAKCTFKIYH